MNNITNQLSQIHLLADEFKHPLNENSLKKADNFGQLTKEFLENLEPVQNLLNRQSLGIRFA